MVPFAPPTFSAITSATASMEASKLFAMSSKCGFTTAGIVGVAGASDVGPVSSFGVSLHAALEAQALAQGRVDVGG